MTQQSDTCDALISAMAVWVFAIREPASTDDFRRKALSNLRAALLAFRDDGKEREGLGWNDTPRSAKAGT